MSDLAAALMVAIRVHANQRDKQGEPYLLHVLRVVEAVADDAKVVAALHDCIDDGGGEARCAVARLSLSEREWVALELLTPDRSCSYGSYIASIDCRPRDDIAREVKLADLRDNLGRIPPRREPRVHGIARSWDAEWASLKARYEKAIATLEASHGAG